MVAHFDKRIVTYQNKKTDNPTEEPIIEDPESTSEDSKRTHSLRNLKRTLSLRHLKKSVLLRNLKRTLSPRTLRRTLSLSLRSFGTLNDFCVAKKLLFGFLMMVYDRVGDGDNY